MGKYIKYLGYVIRHKHYVMLECFAAGLYWRGITHDLSKLLPSEFIPYARYFNGGEYPKWEDVKRTGYPYKYTKEGIQEAFDIAWLKHQRRNKHHWQYWILKEDSGAIKIFPMPQSYLVEMVCDWRGASRAITGKDDTFNWYQNNIDKIQISHFTRAQVEFLLGIHEGLK